MILMIKTTWTLLENLLSQSMKLDYLVTITSSGLPQLTLMRTTPFLFTYTLLT